MIPCGQQAIPITGNGRLHVLHVGKYFPPHLGGMETHLQALCGELQQSVNVSVIVANDARKSEKALVDGVQVTRVGTLFDLASAPVCPGMVRKIREAQADVIHLHLPNPIAILAYLASGHKGLLVVTYHSDIIRQRLLRGAFQPILRRALDRCKALIATSPNYVESSPVLSAYRERCRVIPHGILVERFQRCDSVVVSKIRERYGPRIVVSVGRLIYYKGIEYLIRAMARVKGRLLIVGDGPLRARLEQEAQAHGVGQRVVFLGEIQDVVPFYHAADVFVLASTARSEAFGIVQLEAMACGKPVVNTRLASGVPWVSVDGVTGLTVPPGDSEALAKAINLLLADPERRAKYGQAGRRRVQQEFTLEVMARRTLQLYSDVMRSPIGLGQGN
jgi:glycosyltransferase involved in cell wall biosynthesis